MKINYSLIAIGCLSVVSVLASVHTSAHGDVTPHAVDTKTLPPLGDTWRTENPYRGLPEAIKVGASAYTQNCARCHGLEAVSGGMSPDLRELDSDCTPLKDETKKKVCFSDVDRYFVTAVQQGEERNGTVYMPPFEKVFNQEAIWAIKAYLETRREAD